MNTSENLIKDEAFKNFINGLGQIPLTAHHPSCSYHYRHLLWFGKLPFCLGCSMVTCGIFTGLLMLPRLQVITSQPYYILLTIGVFLYTPALLQILIQSKPYKVVSRFSLGVSLVFLIYSGLWLTPQSWLGLILKAGFLLIFALVWQLTLKIRSKYAVSPCQQCPEGRFPICSYTATRIPKLAEEYFINNDKNNIEANDFVMALQGFYSGQVKEN